MNILLVNIRYTYISGPERYLFNLSSILEKNGHHVIPFSIKYPTNASSQYEEYFVSPLSDNGSIYFRNQRRNLKSTFKTLERNFYSTEVEEGLSRLIADTKPDFAIVLLYLRKLSPAILVALNNMKIPFVVRLSDFGMICPSHNLFRGNEICELCLKGSLLHSVKFKCVQDSHAASVVNYVATKYHLARGYFELIKHFVSPSRFLIEKMIEAGWDRRKFHYLPTFANSQPLLNAMRVDNQIIYAGRLEHIKGVHLLLEAVNILNRRYDLRVKLKVAGSGNEEYVKRLKKYCEDNLIPNVDFLGELEKSELFGLLGESTLSVIPSLCYDNLPNSALESLAYGVPVVAPAHGCFPEIIVERETGVLFEPGNSDDLANRMYMILIDPALLKEMSLKSVAYMQRHHSPEVHYGLLMSIVEAIRNSGE